MKSIWFKQGEIAKEVIACSLRAVASSKVHAGEGLLLSGSEAKADGFYAQKTRPKIQVRKPAST